MIWYKYLYADEAIILKKEKVKWKIRHNAGQIDMYVIVLSRNESDLLEIIPTTLLMQKSYPKKELFVVGVAKGHDKACELACGIIMEVYNKTGGFQVKDYLIRRQYAKSEQVDLCL